MNEQHQRAVDALRSLGFQLSPSEAKFLGGLARLKPETELSPHQASVLTQIVIKYRKSLSRRGYAVPQEMLEAYHDERRRQTTPDHVKYFWVR